MREAKRVRPGGRFYVLAALIADRGGQLVGECEQRDFCVVHTLRRTSMGCAPQANQECRTDIIVSIKGIVLESDAW